MIFATRSSRQKRASSRQKILRKYRDQRFPVRSSLSAFFIMPPPFYFTYCSMFWWKNICKKREQKIPSSFEKAGSRHMPSYFMTYVIVIYESMIHKTTNSISLKACSEQLTHSETFLLYLIHLDSTWCLFPWIVLRHLWKSCICLITPSSKNRKIHSLLTACSYFYHWFFRFRYSIYWGSSLT